MNASLAIERIDARVLTIPTDAPEADGTLAWDRTTMILVEVHAGGEAGLGYTYSGAGAKLVVDATLAPPLVGGAAADVPRHVETMRRAVRNLGLGGIAAAAISAVDVALWDLKARLLGVALVTLFGAARDQVPVYGSGGFTTYDDARLREQLGGWVREEGCRAVKMKIGGDPRRAWGRMSAAREAIADAELMIDANGALERKSALAVAEDAAGLGVTWFEEPVSSDDLEGLRLLRDRVPLEIAAGEYGFDIFHFRRLLASGAVDVLQADATRCGGYTGFLEAAALCRANAVPLSAHTAPALHLPVCLAAPQLRHLEWFHDHVRIEAMLFDGAPVPRDGAVRADMTRAGHGLVLRREVAGRFAV